MLTRKDRRQELAMETFISAFTNAYFTNMDSGQFAFLDEIYRSFAQRTNELREIMEVDLDYLDDYTIVRSDVYLMMFNKARLAADLSYRMIPESFERLNTVANNLLEMSEALTSSLTVCDDMVKALEGNLKRKVSVNSIKDELLHYDTIGTETSLMEGSLSVDKRAGAITLGVLGTESVTFSINSVAVDRSKGTMDIPEIGDKTWDNIDNGYFTSRTFSTYPLLENTDTRDVQRMKDQDMETSYLVEYNTNSDRESLSMNIELSFNIGRVDVMNIVVDPGDYNSVSTSSVILPSLTKVTSRHNGDTEDITDMATNNIIELRGTSAGSTEAEITHKRPDVFPIGSFYLAKKDINGLNIVLTADKPQEIYYPEKEVRDVSGNLLHGFNYFETLVLNKYEPPSGYMNPRLFYSNSEVAEMNRIVETGHTVEDTRKSLFRYFVGIKEIELLRLTYLTIGEAVTNNLNSSGRTIAGVELYVNEYIPEGSTITYQLSTNRIEWYDVSPQGRADSGSTPRRLIFGGLEVEAGDKEIPITTETIYLKVKMTGDGTESPVLKAYAVRIKLI